MYLPEEFENKDNEALFETIRHHGFGLLISEIEGQPFASHVPMLLHVEGDKRSEECFLYGHVARANDHWRHMDGRRSLAIFQGPHAYVSPTWYEKGGVPTWNYSVVHVYGELSVVDDRSQLSDIVIRLSDQYESGRNNPWIPDFPDSMLNGIVGFSLKADEIQFKQKLSQNKSMADRLAQLGHRSTFGKWGS